MLKEEKKLFVVFITPGLFYISFYIIDLLTKFKFSGNHFFNFFMKMNKYIPFSNIMFPYFIPCFLYSILISLIYIFFKLINKNRNKLYFCFIPFGSLIIAIGITFFFIFLIGFYSIFFNGEFM